MSNLKKKYINQKDQYIIKKEDITVITQSLDLVTNLGQLIQYTTSSDTIPKNLNSAHNATILKPMFDIRSYI